MSFQPVNPFASHFGRVRNPWDAEAALAVCSEPSFCNLCAWSGPSFLGVLHSESAACPNCASIARERFLFLCLLARTPRDRYRVLETSPRLGAAYRQAMRSWFDYRASDFDLRFHRADVYLDLQNIDMEDISVDVLLTSHVLEHLPDVDRSLSGIHRLLAEGGRMILQVPILQGRTTPPTEPERHGDDTPVQWRFGPDLTATLRRHGFETRLLCTQELYDACHRGHRSWPECTYPEFDVDSIVQAIDVRDLVPVCGNPASDRLGFRHGYMFLTWEAVKGSSQQS